MQLQVQKLLVSTYLRKQAGCLVRGGGGGVKLRKEIGKGGRSLGLGTVTGASLSFFPWQDQ